jgi:C-terminal processing protease CtpA/Prc
LLNDEVESTLYGKAETAKKMNQESAGSLTGIGMEAAEEPALDESQLPINGGL